MKSSLLVLSVLFLTFIGLIFIFNITYIRNPSAPYLFVKKQIIAVLIGISVMFLISQVRVDLIRRFSPLFMFFVFVLVVLTLFVGSGPGVKRWLVFPGFSVQPSEFFKIALPIFLSSVIAKLKQEGDLDFYKTLVVFMMGVILSAPIALQPDFGNFVFCVLITVFLIFIAGAKIRYLVAISSPTIVGLTLLAVTSPYRLKRLLVFLDPWKDPLGSGYQIIQSMMSYASGGLMGKGIGDGIQKLFFLPSAHTDFIISVIAEETGLMGIFFILVSLSLIAFVGFSSAVRSSDDFTKLLISGLTFCIVFQGVFNLLVTVGLVPTKGITFPFISYGGSSVIANFTGVGVLISSISEVR